MHAVLLEFLVAATSPHGLSAGRRWGILAAEGKRITAESLSLVLGDPAVLARSQTYAFTVLGLSQLFHAVGMRDVGQSVFRE